ncbi:hypothetical protein BJX99DRAFT_270074 [Aspergillus californicus]
MTSRSRASPACVHCRRRRIKCNQLRPRCSQCARAGLSCSGYRAPLDLLFQDETATIVRKVRNEKEMQPAVSQPIPSLSVIIPSLHIEDFAWKYYLQNFNVTRNKSDCFPEPYLTASAAGTASVTSVGLAALALTRQDPHMMALARKKYSAALKYMARAVLDPQEVSMGTTTTASFNLSMFEMITSNGSNAAYSWLRHIHGTAALMHVVHMPSDGAVFATGTTGCLQISFTVAMGCLIKGQPVPLEVIGIVRSVAGADISADVSLVIELLILLRRVVNLYIRTRKSQSAEQRPTDISSALKNMDTDLTNWESRLPPFWTAAHDQSTNWIPRLMGYYRFCRVLTHRAILENTNPSSVGQAVSQQIVKNMCSEIYASVPAMLQNCFDPCLELTSDILLLVTILQALLKVADQRDIVQNWAGPAARALGPGFISLRRFVDRQLC